MTKRSKVLIVFVLLVLLSWKPAAAKHSDLAGTWYDASGERLTKELNGYLQDAVIGDLGGKVIGVIAPHAGFRYSGSIAAFSYNAIKTRDPKTVVLIGFSHKRYIPDTISIFTDERFVTPLGEIKTDENIVHKLLMYGKRIKDLPEVFSQENSLELEIPFIQAVAGEARLVMVALCDQRRDNCLFLVDALLNALKDEEGVVIVGSSDMCHYLTYDEANIKDKATIEEIKKFRPEGFYAKCMKEDRPDSLMCGYGATFTTMTLCKRLGADKVKILKHANSGDTSQKKQRVVGYLSAAFIDTGGRQNVSGDLIKKEDGEMFTIRQKEELLKIARDTIENYLKTGKRLDVKVADDVLKEDMGAFVTLHRKGQLRGCIGHIIATGPLYLTVRDMAIAAAVEDPRFRPLKIDELNDIDIEISVLSPPQKITDTGEIEMGKHGVIVKKGFRSGVYLPQVADETGWNRDQFMDSLCANKAGIPADSWKIGECEIFVFTAEVFGEKELN